jgi:hypothetical protein
MLSVPQSQTSDLLKLLPHSPQYPILPHYTYTTNDFITLTILSRSALGGCQKCEIKLLIIYPLTKEKVLP